MEPVIVTAFFSLTKGFASILFILMILPIIFQVILNMLIGAANSFLKMDIRPFINILFFPGSLLRITVIYFLLNIKGWNLKFGYGSNIGTEAKNTVGSGYFKGFTVYMIPPKKENSVSFWDALTLSLASYTIWGILLLYMMFSGPIIQSIMYVWGVEGATTTYKIILVMLFFGGMPVPDETLLPIYWIISNFPHLILAFMLTLIGSSIITGIYGSLFGEIYFLLISLLVIVRHVIDQRKFNKLTGESEIFSEINIEDILLI